MINVPQFRELVVRPTLEHLDLWSEAAENLLIGTAIQESRLEFLKQVGGGPALGVYQIEPATHRDVWYNFVRFREIATVLHQMVGEPFGAVRDGDLITNLAYATAIARIIYYRVPTPLPDADDIEGLAAYWKEHYNTPLGAGDPDDFEDNYRRFAT